MPAPSPVESYIGPGAFYGNEVLSGNNTFIAGPTFPPTGATFTWQPESGPALTPWPTVTGFSINISTLVMRDSRAPTYYDGANFCVAYVTPGGGGGGIPPLQYQQNATTFTGAYSGAYTPVAFLGWLDYDNILLGCTDGVRTLTLSTQAINDPPVYVEAGATDYYKDWGGSYWAKVGGVWQCAAAGAYLEGIFNTWFNQTFDTYNPIGIVVDAAQGFIVVGQTSDTDTVNYHLYQNGTQTDFPKYTGTVGGSPFYVDGAMAETIEGNFYNIAVGFDGTNYPSLKAAVITYGIGGGAPTPTPTPTPTPWVPPTPVPPPPAPTPPPAARKVLLTSVTNMAHETTGNY